MTSVLTFAPFRSDAQRKRLALGAVLAGFMLAFCFGAALIQPHAAWAQGAPYVRDDAGLVSAEEAQALEEAAAALSDTYNVGVYVITTPESANDEISSFAEKYYLDHDLGVDDRGSGIMFIVATGDRSYIIKTKGLGRELVPDNQAQDIDDDVVQYLKQDDYSGAFAAYLNDADQALGDEVQGMSEEKTNLLIALAIALVVALIAAGGTCFYFYKQMGTAEERSEANEYVNAESFTLSVSHDQYLHTEHLRVKRSSDNDSGGGGGSFGGSSGGHY